MDIDTLIDQLIDECWRTVSSGVKANEFIYGSQLQDFLEEIQKVLQCGDLLHDSERKLLKEMISSKPLFKLYKHEIKKFLLTVVNHTTMVKFLTERAGLSAFNLKLVLSNPSRRSVSRPGSRLGGSYGSPYGSPIKTSTPSFDRFRSPKGSPKGFGSQKRPVSMGDMNPIKSDMNSIKPDIYSRNSIKPDTHSRNSIKPETYSSDSIKADIYTNLMLKDKQINQREEQISILNKENDSLKEENHDLLIRIKEIERKYMDLKAYVETMELKLDSKGISNKSDSLMIKDLIRQCNDRDNTIKHLSEVCEQYQKEFESINSNSIIKTLTSSLKQQEQLVHQLKLKLKLDEPSQPLKTNVDLQQFVLKLPFLKQFIMYYKYKDQHKNFGVIFMNALALILSTTVIITILRVGFLIILYLLEGSSESSLYIYDDYRSDWGDQINMSWWKEIEWVEYFIYNFNDWLEGY